MEATFLEMSFKGPSLGCKKLDHPSRLPREADDLIATLKEKLFLLRVISVQCCWELLLQSLGVARTELAGAELQVHTLYFCFVVL